MKWKPMLAALMLGAAMLTPAAYAAEVQTAGNGYSAVIQIGGGELTGGYETEAQPNIYPVSITIQQIGETPYITKIYEVGGDTSAESLVQNFAQDGYEFTRFDILMQELPGGSESKRVSRTVSAAAASDDKNALLAVLEPIIEYNEAGYTGQLQLDANTISFTETGRSSYRYTVRDTREYTGLDRNDAAYIAKTVQKNGVTLTLESVDWKIAGQTPVDGGFVPVLYNATATYSGSASGSKADGYTATVTYTGEVFRDLLGNKRISVIYRGEKSTPAPLPEPVVEEEPQEKTTHSLTEDLPLILGLTAAGTVIVFGSGFAVRFMKKRRRMRKFKAAYTRKVDP